MLSSRLRTAALSGPSNTLRRITTTAPRSLPPAAQLAEPEPEEYHFQPPPRSPLYLHKPLHLPIPLPPDVQPTAAAPQSTLFPSSPVLDATSMISICLRKPEYTPRAYQIFRKTLDDSAAGLKGRPDASIWGQVVEGLVKMSDEEWKLKAENLVHRWESSFGPLKVGQAVKQQGGLQIYRGWMSGLLRSGASLEPLVPYLLSESLTATELLEGIKPEHRKPVFDGLLIMATKHDITSLKQEVQALQGWEIEQEKRTRHQPPEVRPVSEGAGKLLRAGEEADPAVDNAPRFSVLNLRKSLMPLQSDALPLTRQRELERASLDAAREKLQHSDEKLRSKGVQVVSDTNLAREQLQAWMFQWLGVLTERLKTDLQALKEQVEAEGIPAADDGQHGISKRYEMKPAHGYLYLSLLDPGKLALITILSTMRNAGASKLVPDGIQAHKGMSSIGKAVETEYRAEVIKGVAGDKSPTWLKTLDPQLQQPTPQSVDVAWMRIGRDLEAKEASEFSSVWTPPWTNTVKIWIGSFLLKALIDTALVERKGYDSTGREVTEMHPAFSHQYEYLRGFKHGVVKLNPVVASRLGSDHLFAIVHPKHLPMLVEPRPWNGVHDGAYLIHGVSAMRFKESDEQQAYMERASAQGHLSAVYHGLEVLSSTSWRINRRIFDTVLEVWNAGEGIADIPPAANSEKYIIPQRPIDADLDGSKRLQWAEAARRAQRAQRKDHAERCKFNYTIEIARSYINDAFYLPHNMDFRGRAYPIPSALSPVGDDLSRGLLKFGEAKPLGSTGLNWLRIHLANVYGYDKMSLSDRARFAQDHEAEIFDSADHPLDGKRWWLQAEDPWQCLATCIELTEALRSPDPTKYESSLPVHQDGTCNGMQHYAALGGDVRGAKAVNLTAGDKPADVYAGVAEIVNRIIEQDKADGVPIAMLIKEPVGRKVVKQTVMTTVYGVTYIGARAQIERQLAARGGLDQDHMFAASAYITRTALGCIGDLFRGAKDLMDWLSICARLIAKSIPPDRVEAASEDAKPKKGAGKKPKTSRLPKEFMTAVVWTTPLGLPVVQPYRKVAKKQIMTALQTVYISDANKAQDVNSQRQSTAFPPNFIHSLDATHMMLTALECRKNNITFASVHDSYWTHASTVEDMSKLIRETFIQLHSNDLIGALRQEFLDRFGDHYIPYDKATKIGTSALQRKITAARGMLPAFNVTGQLKDPDSSDDITDTGISQAAPVADLDDMDEDSSGVNAGYPPLSEAEMDAIMADTMNTAEPVTIGKQRYVRLRDVLPLTPKRGDFDVSRIKESTYFFS
ncbi:hypothetical protein BCR39DRAFT_540046 [Naematelia encephala]|uniref:DNA-directed RNA polymerase n=1 Tax=Naematelia encephala TaxID=71784 RepID=A0A1Y2AXF5_9TREE|nr:hypothetical protein BCR39DRAFT_540046 [Naematelia encephala]